MALALCFGVAATVALLSAPSAVSAVATVGEEELAAFESFKAEFGKAYADEAEESLRLEHFLASLGRIESHNALAERSFTKGLNQFSDMSDEEFRQHVLMAPQNCSATHRASPGAGLAGAGGRRRSASDLPDAVDWRESGVISEVKNQGGCGSCWTFSTTGCLEAHLALRSDGATWLAPRLSEQQLVDCAQAFDNHGCNGGLPSHAFEYIHHAGGLDTEFHYPYEGKDSACRFDAAHPPSGPGPSSAGIGARVPGGAVNLTVGDEESLKFHLAVHGPVSIAFQVASDFRDYKFGVYSSTVCRNGPGDVNHAVLAVGYGTDPETQKPYWIVKNSWDYSWGVEGFFKIEAFKNMCGVADCMAFPDLYGLNAAAVGEPLVV